jgi:hypothetical protein
MCLGELSALIGENLTVLQNEHKSCVTRRTLPILRMFFEKETTNK